MGDQGSMMNIGPVGISTAHEWDEYGHDKIVRIFIFHDRLIKSLRFQYEHNGALVMSEWHGFNNGSKFDIVELKYPMEYITRITGHASSRLDSLTFFSNIRQYGPFGSLTRNNSEFAFNLGESRSLGGFFGTKDYDGITSLGIYVKQFTTFPGTTRTTLQTLVVPKEDDVKQ